jgi:hypothetical protein
MIKIRKHEGAIKLELFHYVESEINLKLPKTYVEFILPNDGCCVDPDEFVYFDQEKQRYVGSGVGSFLRFGKNADSSQGLLNEWLFPPQYFDRRLLAFAENNGDYICFDYRKGKANLDPPVVYWSHEAEEGKDVSFLADNFEAFLKMLKTDEEMDELLK